MRFTTALLALAAAGPVFSAAVPSTQDVSSEMIPWILFNWSSTSRLPLHSV